MPDITDLLPAKASRGDVAALLLPSAVGFLIDALRLHLIGLSAGEFGIACGVIGLGIKKAIEARFGTDEEAKVTASLATRASALMTS